MKIPAGILEKAANALANCWDDIGYCLECGSENHNCEPDMEKGPCCVCGKAAVFGAEQLMLRGFGRVSG